MADYLTELTRRLVGFDTVSARSNLEAMAFVAAELDAIGFNVREQKLVIDGQPQINLVAWAGPPEPGGLILSGHIDVVPFADQPGWQRDPLRLEVTDERLFGRGTSDMKAFIAQCLQAARRVDLDLLQRPLVCIFTAVEEVGCTGSERLAPVLPELLGEMPLPTQCWIGEPTSYEIFRAHKGIVLFDVMAEGIGGHSSLPEAGVNAISLMGQAIQQIGELQRELRDTADPGGTAAQLFPEAPYPTLNLGEIEGGTASNMIAERCRMVVSYRPLPGEPPRAIYDEIESRLAALPLSEPGSPRRRGRLRLTDPLVVPAMQSDAGTPLESALAGALGHTADRGAPFATDGGQLAAAGIQSLICGPGELAEAHRPNESIPRDAFARGPALIERVVREVVGQK